VNQPVVGILQRLLGTAAVAPTPQGLPRATPESAEALAAVCRIAHEHRWRFRVEGRGTWLVPDAPADFALSSRGLDQIVSVSPADLVATVQAGAPLDAVRRQLADSGMWLAVDPPGRSDRTIGSILATATAGPLRQAFGPIRDQVLGCTAATGDGRLVTTGGRVVKNVAGYDLTKLQVGGFGGFGIITEAHLRLRALPRADQTFITRGSRDALTAAGRAILAAHVGVAALELLSPALAADSQWVLATRFVGGEAAVLAESRRLTAQASLPWQELPVERSHAFWALAGRASLGGPVSLRMGALLDGLDTALDLLLELLDEGLISAGAGSGMIRWSGEATADRLRVLRSTAATHEIPLTLERAPWEVRQQLGHFGAYHEGVGQLVGRLRDRFDPGQQISVALEGSER
jgi:glycolate oxidase FAD binding subunit